MSTVLNKVDKVEAIDTVEEHPTQKLEQAQKKTEEYIINAVKVIKAQEDKIYHELLESAHDNDQTFNSQLDALEDMLDFLEKLHDDVEFSRHFNALVSQERLENDPKSFLVGFSKEKNKFSHDSDQESDQDLDQDLDHNSDEDSDFENTPFVSRGGKHA